MLGFGLSVAMIGLGVVFGVLVFLVFVINAITAVSRMVEKKPEAAVQQVSAVAAASVQEDENEILAVIAGAILALEEVPRERFVPIKRVGGDSVPAWVDPGHGKTMSLKVFSY